MSGRWVPATRGRVSYWSFGSADQRPQQTSAGPSVGCPVLVLGLTAVHSSTSHAASHASQCRPNTCASGSNERELPEMDATNCQCAAGVQREL